MRIECIGGGPASLYFSILMKKAHPDAAIAVHERNQPDDTFGWGVVFSEETLGHFRDADAESYDRIRDAFAYWDDIETWYDDTCVTSTGHGFCGLARRTMLQILHERAPGIFLHTEPPSDTETSYQRLRTGELDFALGTFDTPPAGIHREMLSTDRVIFLAREGHPRIKKAPSKEQLKKEPQLLPTPITGGKLPSSLMSLLERRQDGPYFIGTTPHLLASLFIASQTDIVTATLERVARMYKETLGLVILSPPIALPAADTHIIWHERTHHSSAHRWLLDLLIELARN